MIDNENLRSEECEAVFSELSAYIDGELDAENACRVQAHLERCEKCRKLLAELSALSEDIETASISYPADLHSRIMSALGEEMAKGRKKSRIVSFGEAMKKHGMWIGAGVAAVICLAIIGSPVFRGNFDFAMNDSKAMAMEMEIGDAVMPQSNGIGVACEMSRTNDGDGLFYTADEEYSIEAVEISTSNNLSDKVDDLCAEMETPSSYKADGMDMTDAVSESEKTESDPACGERKYPVVPTFMLPRGELGEVKTELFH